MLQALLHKSLSKIGQQVSHARDHRIHLDTGKGRGSSVTLGGGSVDQSCSAVRLGGVAGDSVGGGAGRTRALLLMKKKKDEIKLTKAWL